MLWHKLRPAHSFEWFVFAKKWLCFAQMVLCKRKKKWTCNSLISVTWCKTLHLFVSIFMFVPVLFNDLFHSKRFWVFLRTCVLNSGTYQTLTRQKTTQEPPTVCLEAEQEEENVSLQLWFLCGSKLSRHQRTNDSLSVISRCRLPPRWRLKPSVFSRCR